MRTAYLGTSEFAATVLRRLAASPHRPSLVVTPPDRRQGRGRKVQPPPAALAAGDLGLDLLQAENVNEPEALQRIRAAEPEAVLVCAFGQLIREPLLSDYPMLNVHPSLLPRWRGAAPIERAMMARDETTGVCVMQLTEGLDSGPVALREETAIDPGEDFGALSARLAALGGDLLVRALDLQAEGALEFAEQDEDGSPTRRRSSPPSGGSTPSARRPSWRPRSAPSPRTSAPTWSCRAASGSASARPRGSATSFDPGTLAERDGDLLFGTGEGALRLEVVQPAGGKPMPADAYLRGHPLPGA